MMVYLSLLFAFMKIGVFSFGGGYAILSMISSEIVTNYGWLTEQEFSNLVTISQLTPGPIAINSATFVGTKIGGPLGSVCATFGLILPSIIIMTVISILYNKFKAKEFSKGILWGMRPATTGLIASAAVTLIIAALFTSVANLSFATLIENIDIISLILCVAAFVCIRFFKQKPILMILACGAVGLGAYYLMELLKL